MRLILVGPPGAGKGTQAVNLAAHFSIPHISTGDIFRSNLKEGTPLGMEAKSYMDRGELVPDEVTNKMLKDRLGKSDVGSGFLLDGFPRNVFQAEVLRAILNEKQTPLHAALELSVNEEEIIKRLAGRRTCKECSRAFHLDYEPSKQEGVCDGCGGALYQRDDDKEEVIARRLEVYNEQTAPIIDFYRREGLLVTIPAMGPVGEITERAVTALNAIR
ncbi:MAG: adenylate kinase [Candidatus Nanopelagicaceae bacterium]